jgi:hypothetical protein
MRFIKASFISNMTSGDACNALSTPLASNDTVMSVMHSSFTNLCIELHTMVSLHKALLRQPSLCLHDSTREYDSLHASYERVRFFALHMGTYIYIHTSKPCTYASSRLLVPNTHSSFFSAPCVDDA